MVLPRKVQLPIQPSVPVRPRKLLPETSLHVPVMWLVIRLIARFLGTASVLELVPGFLTSRRMIPAVLTSAANEHPFGPSDTLVPSPPIVVQQLPGPLMTRPLERTEVTALFEVLLGTATAIRRLVVIPVLLLLKKFPMVGMIKKMTVISVSMVMMLLTTTGIGESPPRILWWVRAPQSECAVGVILRELRVRRVRECDRWVRFRACRVGVRRPK